TSVSKIHFQASCEVKVTTLPTQPVKTLTSINRHFTILIILSLPHSKYLNTYSIRLWFHKKFEVRNLLFLCRCDFGLHQLTEAKPINGIGIITSLKIGNLIGFSKKQAGGLLTVGNLQTP